MDIPTFGALLRFAMELEKQYLTAYEEASRETDDTRIKEMFLNLAQANNKSQSLVERLYNESIFSDMDIGVQEPISGLRRSDYLAESKPFVGTGRVDFLKMAIKREERAQQFYLDAALQVKARRPAVARSLEKLAKEKTERKAKLESLML
ncbi:hypothetical protein ACFLSK_01920 [Chloroflexota bacterium]